jgi:hypothetical protein
VIRSLNYHSELPACVGLGSVYIIISKVVSCISEFCLNECDDFWRDNYLNYMNTHMNLYDGITKCYNNIFVEPDLVYDNSVTTPVITITTPATPVTPSLTLMLLCLSIKWGLCSAYLYSLNFNANGNVYRRLLRARKTLKTLARITDNSCETCESCESCERYYKINISKQKTHQFIVITCYNIYHNRIVELHILWGKNNSGFLYFCFIIFISVIYGGPSVGRRQGRGQRWFQLRQGCGSFDWRLDSQRGPRLQLARRVREEERSGKHEHQRRKIRRISSRTSSFSIQFQIQFHDYHFNFSKSLLFSNSTNLSLLMVRNKAFFLMNNNVCCKNVCLMKKKPGLSWTHVLE